MASVEGNPSSSPPKPRQRRNKPNDPWTKLASTPLHSPPPSPKANEAEPQESLLTRIIISPLLFTSFLLSLFLINHRDRLRRTHSQPGSSILSYLSPSAWIDPEPYQDSDDSTWQLERRDASAPDALKPEQALGSDGGDLGGKRRRRRGRRGWFFHTKGRAMTKLEVGDAFEMRGRVMVGLMVGLVGVVVGGILGVRWVVGTLWGR